MRKGALGFVQIPQKKGSKGSLVGDSRFHGTLSWFPLDKILHMGEEYAWMEKKIEIKTNR